MKSRPPRIPDRGTRRARELPAHPREAHPHHQKQGKAQGDHPRRNHRPGVQAAGRFLRRPVWHGAAAHAAAKRRTRSSEQSREGERYGSKGRNQRVRPDRAAGVPRHGGQGAAGQGDRRRGGGRHQHRREVFRLPAEVRFRARQVQGHARHREVGRARQRTTCSSSTATRRSASWRPRSPRSFPGRPSAWSTSSNPRACSPIPKRRRAISPRARRRSSSPPRARAR